MLPCSGTAICEIPGPVPPTPTASGSGTRTGRWSATADRTPQAGTITSVGTGVKADLTHSALNTLGGHRVDGGRSIVLVEVTSTPMLETDTYGADETIRFHGDLQRSSGRDRGPGFHVLGSAARALFGT